ncbi:MAG TPA: hypothetical protein PKC72_03950 [Chitinophagaceae bacterium]|nr:hypothetical protein [Chitinophagaceae bacterium]
MTKHLIFILLLSLKIYSQSGNEDFSNYIIIPQSHLLVFAAYDSLSDARFIKVSGETDNQRTVIKWTIDENKTADMFEVEKSVEGENYRLVALVFASEKSSKENYWFVDKADEKKVKYRVKLINKDKKEEYSQIIEVDPVEA